MCPTRGERKLISIQYQKESVRSEWITVGESIVSEGIESTMIVRIDACK